MNCRFNINRHGLLIILKNNFLGKCNVNETDDLTTSNGTITDNINDFGQSWLLKDLPPSMYFLKYLYFICYYDTISF